MDFPPALGVSSRSSRHRKLAQRHRRQARGAGAALAGGRGPRGLKLRRLRSPATGTRGKPTQNQFKHRASTDQGASHLFRSTGRGPDMAARSPVSPANFLAISMLGLTRQGILYIVYGNGCWPGRA